MSEDEYRALESVFLAREDALCKNKSPDGRMKPSGVRGKSYHWMEFSGVENATGRPVRCTIKAICRDNAVKRLAKSCTWNI